MATMAVRTTVAFDPATVAWWEFEYSPVLPKGILLMRSLLTTGGIRFDGPPAKEAARLFTAAGDRDD